MIELKSLKQATPSQYVELLNDPSVTKHMPLASQVDEDWCREWIEAKVRLWPGGDLHGPWSVWIAGEFAGWAGLQPDLEFESGLAIVLSKDHWRYGVQVLASVVNKAQLLGLATQTLIEFPPTRSAGRVLGRLGFREISPTEISGVSFSRYLVKLDELAARLSTH